MEGSAKTSPKSTQAYMSNPYRASIEGIVMILTKNPITALLVTLLGGLVVGVLYLLSFLMIVVDAGVLGALFVVLMFVAAVLFVAASMVIAAKSALGESVSTQEAINIAKPRALPFIGMSFLVGLAISLGTAVFILPGLYLAGRLTLAPIVFFAEKLGAIDSIKRSWALTNGRVVEMLGALIASSFLQGGGLLAGATVAGPLVNRYHGYIAVEKGAKQPKLHYLNWVNLAVVGAFLAVYALFMVALAANYNNWSSEYGTPRDSRYDDMRMFDDFRMGS